MSNFKVYPDFRPLLTSTSSSHSRGPRHIPARLLSAASPDCFPALACASPQPVACRAGLVLRSEPSLTPGSLSVRAEVPPVASGVPGPIPQSFSGLMSLFFNVLLVAQTSLQAKHPPASGFGTILCLCLKHSCPDTQMADFLLTSLPQMSPFPCDLPWQLLTTVASLILSASQPLSSLLMFSSEHLLPPDLRHVFCWSFPL